MNIDASLVGCLLAACRVRAADTETRESCGGGASAFDSSSSSVAPADSGQLVGASLP